MPPGATVKTDKAAIGFRYCSKLFSMEKDCEDMNEKHRKEYRQNITAPVPEEYFCWVNTLEPENGSKLAEAVRYAGNQREALSAFLSHGEVPISNNLAENAIRPFAVGRKNRLFCDTVKGAESGAIVYSMVETAKANGIEPYQYLHHILTELPNLEKSPSHDGLDSLMPWNPYVKQECNKNRTPKS